MKHHPSHSSTWLEAAIRLLAAVRASEGLNATSQLVAETAALDADDLIEQWLKRFPEEAPR